MARRRAPTEPHIEIHKEVDGWHPSIFDFDPVTGFIVVTTVVATFAAALTWVARMRGLLGGDSS